MHPIRVLSEGEGLPHTGETLTADIKAVFGQLHPPSLIIFSAN